MGMHSKPIKYYCSKTLEDKIITSISLL